MERNISQKISLFFALLCYFVAIGCLIGAMLYNSRQPNDPVLASLIASAIFFVGTGIVLHVIARTRLKGLISFNDREK